MPDIPAPTISTSSPRRSAGIEPSPTGWVIQSSKGNGKSGPNIVTGRSELSSATVNSFTISESPPTLDRKGNGEFCRQLPREPHVTHLVRGGHRVSSADIRKLDVCIIRLPRLPSRDLRANNACLRQRGRDSRHPDPWFSQAAVVTDPSLQHEPGPIP